MQYGQLNALTMKDCCKVTDYVGNKVYENGGLKRILIDGGYIENNAYHFYLTDHLGNNRVVTNATGVVVQKNHYYPFGMAFAETSTAEQGKQPYKYNNKELDLMHGVNMYDYSARYMDGIRFTSVDPLAEKYYSISPYCYVGNNPIKFIDKDGRQIDFPPIFGSPESWRAAAVQQKAEKIQANAAIPAAVSVSVGVQTTVGLVSLKKTTSVKLILKGNDAPSIRMFETETIGTGTPEASVSLSTETTHTSNPDKFGVESIEGKSTDVSVGAGGKIAGVELSLSEAKLKDGTTVTTKGIGVTAGLTDGPVGGSVGISVTRETIISKLANLINDYFSDENKNK